MPRRKSIKKQEQLTKPPKVVPVLFSAAADHSPHLLDLREKLAPQAAPAWQLSPLDHLLTRPLTYFKLKAVTRPRPLVVEEGKISLDYGQNTRTREHKNTRTLEPALSSYFPLFYDQVKKTIKPFNNLTIEKTFQPLFSFHLPKIRFPQISLPEINCPTLNFLSSWQKTAIGFLVMGLIFILPLKAFSAYADLKESQNKIIAYGSEAFQHLEIGQSALLAKDMVKATAELQTALNLFSQTQNQLNELNPLVRLAVCLIPGQRQIYFNGEHLMMAGQNLTLAALPLISAFTSINKTEPPTEHLIKLSSALEQTLPKFQAVKKHLAQVNPVYLPANYLSIFDKTKEEINFLTADLEKFQPLLPTLNQILGAEIKKRYLLIFQNNNEIRPTGGFIGSFALLDVEKGQIKKLDLPGGGPYDLSGSLKVALLPPAPLQLLKSRWEFQDANWFADFPTSAKKLAWFYEKSGGPTVDGVIAMDTFLFIDLLKITGEIAMPEYNKNIKAENFVYETQKQVEIDYDKAQNKPKQFLADLAPRLIAKIFASNDFASLLATLNKNLAERHLQLYFADSRLEEQMMALGWGGEFKQNPTGDYLAVINTNIAGGKTDGVIKQTIHHQAKIEIDGSVVDTVTITREHRGQPGDIFTDLQNVDYLRVYAPAGSQMIRAEGFTYPEEKHFKVAEKWYKIDEDLKKIEQNQTIDEKSGTVITNELGKTSFGNWVLTKPGQTTTVSLTYKLPGKIKMEKPAGWLDSLKEVLSQNQDYLSYSLLVQKQAGTQADNFQSEIFLPPAWQPLWTEPANQMSYQNSQLNFKGDLEEDRYLGVVVQTK